ncbi:DUF4270 domain-containing protein [Christiangramia fulva]|uniref:DUF4270 domain-containing protein n=1 Tax=Christiangramia fulva TaxID=2126553 RepID=A0A2R3Z2R0_9FLAO|nr:DUF4270 domain-containing protein [Christiangramia fulva]AVR44532.1 DUF4270 domain-containing protein [Christiangramia fulva]
MKLNKLIQFAAVLVALSAFTACDEDYSKIGGEIINNPTDVKMNEYEVDAYSQKINSVQTNNLANLVLGTYKDPVYGESTASIVTQLSLSRVDPEFGTNPQLDSVVLTLPYYSTETAESTTDDPRYKLDSIFGGGSFKLSVYETSYFLNDLDPETDFEQRQKYFSDQQPVVEQHIVGDPLFVDPNFKPSAVTYDTYEVKNGETDTVTNAPALRIKLPIAFFQNKILNKEGSSELMNNGNFRNYFRSLFIKAEPNETDGSQILFNFSGSDLKISLYYTHEVEEEVDGNTTTVNKQASYDLMISGGIHFNTYSGEFPDSVLQAINEQDQNSNGSEKLYVKGEEGSMVVIDLFPDESVLQDLIDNKMLVNEANLIFYVDQEAVANSEEPERLLLYNLDNNTLLADYDNDPVTNSVSRKSKLTFAPLLERGEDDKGIFYKIRITQHLSNLINENIENVRLGLVVPGNINVTNFSAVRGIENVQKIPSTSLFTPLGTVLYGDEAADPEKRLKLRIYYTDYN